MAEEHDQLDERCASFYRRAMAVLREAKVPFLVGGAFALKEHAGIDRFTKDFDVFILPADAERALEALRRAGYPAEVTARHWLGKAFYEDLFVDLIWSSGNGVAAVDDEWLEHAVEAEVLGVPAGLVPAEEMIWQKAYIQERERYDGADIMHIIHARAERLDWPRLLRRFADHWRVLLAHLILYGFAYPDERERVPLGVIRGLLERLEGELATRSEAKRILQGTLLSRMQYADDVATGLYRDARLLPPADLTEEDLEA